MFVWVLISPRVFSKKVYSKLRIKQFPTMILPDLIAECQNRDVLVEFGVDRDDLPHVRTISGDIA